MQNLNLLVAGLLVFALQTLTAQTRFVDPLFSVSGPTTVTYANNIDVRTGTPMARDLTMDVYQPVGDTLTAGRPVVVIWPTGSFLPQYFNGTAYGSKVDSVNVEIARRLVQRGYVAIVAEYRLGWNPTSDDQAVRTGTLLRAVYRASQDAHALGRYLRRTVAEDGNPYNIDTDRITYWGNGSGGYLALAHAFLDDIDEILTNENFYDEMNEPLVNLEANSNPQGTTETPQNLINSPGYTSEVALTVNMAGALGDTAWIDTTENEPAVIAYHSLSDPFAPFYAGLVQVPVEDGSLPVIDVLGSNLVVRIANESGLNDKMGPANALSLPNIFPALSSAVNQRNEVFKSVTLQSQIPDATNDEFQLSRDNMYPIFRSDRGATAGIYNWFDEPTLRATVAATNTQIPTANIDIEEIIEGESIVNPNRNNPAAAKLFIDTLMAHFLPRAYYQLDLADLSTSTKDVLTNASVGLELFPNPSATGFNIRVNEGLNIRQIDVYDFSGRRVAEYGNINRSSYVLERGNLKNGQYILQLRFDEGSTARKVFLR